MAQRKAFLLVAVLPRAVNAAHVILHGPISTVGRCYPGDVYSQVYLSDTTDRGSERKLRIKAEKDQVESFYLLILILCLSSDSGRHLSEMYADVFHFLVTLVPWLNKPNAFLTKEKKKI